MAVAHLFGSLPAALRDARSCDARWRCVTQNGMSYPAFFLRVMGLECAPLAVRQSQIAESWTSGRAVGVES